MLTVVFLVIFGGLVVGFMIWVMAFGGMKRRGQSGAGELNKQSPKESRAPGLD